MSHFMHNFILPNFHKSHIVFDGERGSSFDPEITRKYPWAKVYGGKYLTGSNTLSGPVLFLCQNIGRNKMIALNCQSLYHPVESVRPNGWVYTKAQYWGVQIYQFYRHLETNSKLTKFNNEN